MRKLIAAIGGTVFGSLLIVATVAAADPTPSPSSRLAASGGAVATVLGLSQAQVQDLRHDGLSLAQIAAQQKVEVQKVIDALVARWRDRIEARVATGALTETEATQLQTQLMAQAQSMVASTAPGGMQGAAVGAGPRDAAGSGDTMRARDGSGTGTGDGLGPRGTGDGTCDGTGPHGAGQP
jgi:hypothetical protein